MLRFALFALLIVTIVAKDPCEEALDKKTLWSYTKACYVYEGDSDWQAKAECAAEKAGWLNDDGSFKTDDFKQYVNDGISASEDLTVDQKSSALAAVDDCMDGKSVRKLNFRKMINCILGECSA